MTLNSLRTVVVAVGTLLWLACFVSTFLLGTDMLQDYGMLVACILGASFALPVVVEPDAEAVPPVSQRPRETPAEVERALFSCRHTGGREPVWTTEETPRLVATLCADCYEEVDGG